jgi:hypothetical protein
MMKAEVSGIRERFKRARIGLKDALAVLDMTLEDHLREHEALFPYEVFEGLSELIDRTVHGTKIERLRPKEGRGPFHTFEILSSAMRSKTSPSSFHGISKETSQKSLWIMWISQ